MFNSELRKRVEQLERRVTKLDNALHWPTMAEDDGYKNFQEIMLETGSLNYKVNSGDFHALLKHLGLTMEKGGTRIVKLNNRKGKK